MKCDAKKLDHLKGGFTCTILGDTIGANWVWEWEPYKTKIKNSPECDAKFTRKKGLFGKKCYFKCWIMDKFRVKWQAEKLEARLDALKNR